MSNSSETDQALQPLQSGLSGARVFANRTANVPYVVRLLSEKTTKAHYQREIACTELAMQLGIGPALLETNEQDRRIVLAYLPGTALTQTALHDTQCLAHVIAIFHMLHQTHCPITAPSLNTRIDARIADGSRAPFIAQCLPKKADLQQRIDPACMPQGFCHYDAYDTNWIVHNYTLKLIDWSEAGMGNPLEDLAIFCFGMGLSFTAQRDLLEKYLAPTPLTEALFLQFRIAYALNLLYQSVWAWDHIQDQRTPFAPVAIETLSEHYHQGLFNLDTDHDFATYAWACFNGFMLVSID